jgi:hypothetical protein
MAQRTSKTTTQAATQAADEAQAAATGTTSDSGEVTSAPEVGIVQTADGSQHIGEVPASAATVLDRDELLDTDPGDDVAGEVVNPLPGAGDHDRVAMLSVRNDGTLDQHAPELIGDPALAQAATRRQFAEQAVSAVDVRIAAAMPAAGSAVTIIGAPDGEPDTVIPLTTDATTTAASVRELHEAAAEAAIKAADAVVERLTSGS